MAFGRVSKAKKYSTDKEHFGITWKSEEKNCSKKQLSSITLETGIKRVPILRRLSIDFFHAFPFDSMQQVFLGWTKHLLLLCLSLHNSCQRFVCRYKLSQAQLNIINSSLCQYAPGIQSSWGRPPRSLTYLEKFKAEQLKKYGTIPWPMPIWWWHFHIKNWLHYGHQVAKSRTLSVTQRW